MECSRRGESLAFALLTHLAPNLRLRQLPNSSLVQLRQLQRHALDAWHGRQLQREQLALLHRHGLLPTPPLRRMALFPSLQGLLVAQHLGLCLKKKKIFNHFRGSGGDFSPTGKCT